MTERASSSALRLWRRPKIKLCRVDTLQGAVLAWETGMDFIGLHVIRRLSQKKCHRFRRILDLIARFRVYRMGPERGPCEPVLVTHSMNPRVIADWCRRLDFRCVQLHNHLLTVKIVCAIRSSVENVTGHRIEIIRTIVANSNRDATTFLIWANNADALLFDSKGPGGSAKKANWRVVRQVRDLMPMLPAFIAGGIKPQEGRLAIERTGTNAVDVQSFCEVPTRQAETTKGKVKRKKRKHIREVITLCATVRRVPRDRCVQNYLVHRAELGLLLSVADLKVRVAREAIRACENLPVDGLQIDVSDGSTVPRWAIDPIRWAQIAWNLAPEMPIWLHVFSQECEYVHRITIQVAKVNPHLIGVFLQCPAQFHPSEWLTEIARKLTKVQHLVIAPSFSARQIAQASPKDLSASLRRVRAAAKGLVLVTAPDEAHELPRRAAETMQAIHTLRTSLKGRNELWRIGVDRGISLSVLSRIRRERPDFVVAGRGLVKTSINTNVSSYLSLLKSRPTHSHRS